MRKKTKVLLLFLCMLSMQAVRADVVMLVPGYTGTAASWEYSGVNEVLQQHGWARAGVLGINAAGIHFVPALQPVSTQHRVYNVELFSEAPLLVQSQQLVTLVGWVSSRHPQDKIILVAHSAGGLVSRLVMLGPEADRVAALITIASPHLGTFRAGQAIDAVESKPFFCPGPGWDMMKSFFGGREYDLVRRTEPLLSELLPSRPGSLIFWLNRQVHAKADYYSIARGNFYMNGDELVPGYSQDMNNVPALEGRSTLFLTERGHALGPADGLLVAAILQKYQFPELPD